MTKRTIMIYETCVLTKVESGPEVLDSYRKIVEEVCAQHQGELLIAEDWGVRTLAQSTSRGVDRGRYLYFMFRASTTANLEMERRFNITESKLKFVLLKLGEDKFQDSFTKNHKSPFSSTEEERRAKFDAEKEKRMFSKRRSCWFTANKTQADWKDPGTYTWLLNEFGKINPARGSGVKVKHQNKALRMIKVARILGIISHTNGRQAY